MQWQVKTFFLLNNGEGCKYTKQPANSTSKTDTKWFLIFLYNSLKTHLKLTVFKSKPIKLSVNFTR